MCGFAVEWWENKVELFFTLAYLPDQLLLL